MICIHHNDLDGRCSAAIVNMTMKSPDYDINFYEVDYSSNNLPLDKVKKDEPVIIVDFSLSDDNMKKLEAITSDITWIDHHATAKNYYYQNLNGLRDFKDKSKAGCELAWEFYFPNIAIPESVLLLGDYDKFSCKLEQCFNFHEGMKIEYNHPESPLWIKLFDGDRGDDVKRICANGVCCINYRDIYYQDMLADFGYEAKFNGNTAFVANLYGFGSPPFGDIIDKYDFIISYIYNGKTYSVSLYSKKIDVSIIAKKYGGGGHKGASGFSCEELPFKPLNIKLEKSNKQKGI